LVAPSDCMFPLFAPDKGLLQSLLCHNGLMYAVHSVWKTVPSPYPSKSPPQVFFWRLAIVGSYCVLVRLSFTVTNTWEKSFRGGKVYFGSQFQFKVGYTTHFSAWGEADHHGGRVMWWSKAAHLMVDRK
jgi:hypothetical protein